MPPFIICANSFRPIYGILTSDNKFKDYSDPTINKLTAAQFVIPSRQQRLW